jgi:hypothetical protein
MKFRMILAVAASIAAVIAIMRRQQTPALPNAELGTWSPIPVSPSS